ncbi:MAG: hypothetical protein QW734_04675 [Candidatus Bathyarchaeia archaeon]
MAEVKISQVKDRIIEVIADIYRRRLDISERVNGVSASMFRFRFIVFPALYTLMKVYSYRIHVLRTYRLYEPLNKPYPESTYMGEFISMFDNISREYVAVPSIGEFIPPPGGGGVNILQLVDNMLNEVVKYLGDGFKPVDYVTPENIPLDMFRDMSIPARYGSIVKIVDIDAPMAVKLEADVEGGSATAYITPVRVRLGRVDVLTPPVNGQPPVESVKESDTPVYATVLYLESNPSGKPLRVMGALMNEGDVIMILPEPHCIDRGEYEYTAYTVTVKGVTIVFMGGRIE